MTTPPKKTSGAARVADIVVTVLLIVVGVTYGVFSGGLSLVFAAASTAEIGWAAASIALMVVPIVTAVLGIVRLARGRVAFWVPLIGLVAVFGLLALLGLLSAAV
jgi:hypothetical protein